MPFDPKTAKPYKSVFDPSTARLDTSYVPDTAAASSTAAPQFNPPNQSQNLSDLLARFVQNFNVGVRSPGGIASGLGEGAKVGLPMLAGLVTGGASIPIAGALGFTGNALNEATQNALHTQNKSLGDIAKESAITGGLAAAGQGTALGISKAMEKTAPWLYGTSLKPSPGLLPAERNTIIEAALNRKIPVSNAGYNLLEQKVNELTQAGNAAVAAGTQAGQKMNLPQVLGPKFDALEALAPNTENPERFLQIVQSYKKSFLNNRTDLTPDDFLTLRRDVGTKLGPYFKAKQVAGYVPKPHEMEMNQVRSDVYFAMRDELEKQFPVLKEVNPDNSALIKLKGYLARAVGRIDNREILSLQDVGAGIAGAAGTEDVKMGPVMALISKVFNNPNVKSRIAYTMKSLSKLPNVGGAVGTTTSGAISQPQPEQ